MSDESNETATATENQFTTIQDLQAFVSALIANEPAELAAGARGYTLKNGFRAQTPLENTPLDTLMGMAACINSAIAGHIVNETDGAQEGMNLVIEHAQNAVTVYSNQMKFDKFYNMAIELGYGEDFGEEHDVETQTSIVDALLSAQPNNVNSWAEHLASQS